MDGLSEVSVSCARDAYEVLSTGWVNRKVASTSMNRESSRSHAVFTLTIESKKRVHFYYIFECLVVRCVWCDMFVTRGRVYCDAEWTRCTVNMLLIVPFVLFLL